MAEDNPYALLSNTQTSANPYALLSDDVEDNTLPITEYEFLEQQRQANKEAAVEKEYQKYQDPRVYEDAATPADLRKMSTIALDPLLLTHLMLLQDFYKMIQNKNSHLTLNDLEQHLVQLAKSQ